MRTGPKVRKLTLTVHLIISIGWLGAILSYLCLAITGLRSQQFDLARAAYLAMHAIGWRVIVPLSGAALFSGLLQSLSTEWGLFRHYWIVVKLILTTISCAILWKHMSAVSQMSEIAQSASTFGSDVQQLRTSLVVHAAGGLMVLIFIAVISMFKPWGRTPYGKRLLQK